MSRPFKPIGERARWRVIYDLLRKAAVAEVVTYEELATALNLDPLRDRHTLQMAVRRAGKELEEVNNHALDVVPNKGYMIVPAREHLTLARRHQKRANRALARGQSKVVHVDLSGLDPETRAAFETVARAFALQMEFNKRFNVRQNRLEKTVNAMTQRTERTEEEIAELKGRLARLEETA